MKSFIRRTTSIHSALTLAGVVILAGMVVGTGTSQAYNGLPDNLVNCRGPGTESCFGYRWVGNLDATFATETKGRPPLDEYVTQSATAEYSNLDGIGDPMTSDLKVDFTLKQYGCHPSQLDYTTTATWDGPWGRYDTKPTISLQSTPDGFLFTPMDLFNLPKVTKFETSCIYGEPGYTATGYQLVQWFPSDPYSEEGPKPSRLREDTDPDPYHLVGSTTWTLADPPDDTVFDESYFAAWEYTVNYDLKLVAIPRAKLGKVVVEGPSAARKGKTAKYRVKISNTGSATATGIGIRVNGRGVGFHASIGKLPAGDSEKVTVKLKPKKAGKIKAAFKVTSANAGGKTVKRKITVRE